MADKKIGPETRARITQAWPDILARIAGGQFIKDTLKEYGFSDAELRAYLATEPNARAEWDAAKEQSADAFMLEALEVARNPFEEVSIGPDGKRLAEPLIVRRDSAHARTYIDTLKWAARIRNPRAYSDKQTLDVNVKTVDLTRIIQDANARLAAATAGRVIEGAVVRAALPQSLDDLL